MGNKTNRLNQLTSILRERGTTTVKEISALLNVSEMTVRRDLDSLQASHIVERTHGKASLIQGYSPNYYENIENIYSLSSASTTMNEEKKRIAQYAAGLIEQGDVLILDNGSTTDKLAEYIPEHQDLTVAFYNLNILLKLVKKENINLIFAGGYFHPSDQMFESAEGVNFLKTIRANKLFLSASGVHEKLGMTCAHDFEVIVKQAVLQTALQKILIADSSKFGAIKTVFFAQIEAVDMIITDKGLSQEWANIIRDKNVELIMV